VVWLGVGSGLGVPVPGTQVDGSGSGGSPPGANPARLTAVAVAAYGDPHHLSPSRPSPFRDPRENRAEAPTRSPSRVPVAPPIRPSPRLRDVHPEGSGSPVAALALLGLGLHLPAPGLAQQVTTTGERQSAVSRAATPGPGAGSGPRGRTRTRPTSSASTRATTTSWPTSAARGLLRAAGGGEPPGAADRDRRTFRNNPIHLVFISSEENLARLDRWREIAERLARAHDVDEAEARRPRRGGEAIVWIDNGLHSTEVAHAQHGPLLAWYMATDESEETRRIRDDVILLLVPQMNPDGHEVVVNWYRRNLGTEWETTSPPEVYHEYVGHDINRDWFMFRQNESQAVARSSSTRPGIRRSSSTTTRPPPSRPGSSSPPSPTR
jgi:hypothetical protein